MQKNYTKIAVMQPRLHNHAEKAKKAGKVAKK
jgi:hypothetical protein